MRKGQREKAKKSKRRRSEWTRRKRGGKGAALGPRGADNSSHDVYTLTFSFNKNPCVSKQHKELILTSGLASSLLHTPMESCQKGCCFLYAGCSTPIHYMFTLPKKIKSKFYS